MFNKIKNFTKWIKSKINKIDELFAKWFDAELEPKVYSIIKLIFIAYLATMLLCYICIELCGISEDTVMVIALVASTAYQCYIIKMLIPNAKKINSIFKKILYVFLNLMVTGFIVSVVISIVMFAINLAIFLVMAYVVFAIVFNVVGSSSSSSSGDTWIEGTLSDGTEITAHKGGAGDGTTYKGNDGNEYRKTGPGSFKRN